MEYNWPQYIPEELSEVIRMYRYLTELFTLINEGESKEVSLESKTSQLSVQWTWKLDIQESSANDPFFFSSERARRSHTFDAFAVTTIIIFDAQESFTPTPASSQQLTRLRSTWIDLLIRASPCLSWISWLLPASLFVCLFVCLIQSGYSR
jgi:hypothetical protein